MAWSAIVTNIEVIVTSGSSAVRSLHDVDEGNTAGNSNSIYSASKSTNDSLVRKVVVSNGNSLWGQADAENAITVTCYGVIFKSGN